MDHECYSCGEDCDCSYSEDSCVGCDLCLSNEDYDRYEDDDYFWGYDDEDEDLS